MKKIGSAMKRTPSARLCNVAAKALSRSATIRTSRGQFEVKAFERRHPLP
jgi:hypothetical protein